MDDPVEWLLLVGAVATALLAIGKVLHNVLSEINDGWKKFKAVLDSYLGTPANEFHSATPSIPQRMEQSENNLETLVGQMTTITHNVRELKSVAEEAIEIGKVNAGVLKDMSHKFEEGEAEREAIMKASNRMREAWAEKLGIDIPAPDELEKYGH